MTQPLPRRSFGSTGHSSSAVIFGAAALMANNPAVNERALALLLEYGVNHIDVAAKYGNAELAVGTWLPEHRDRFFLATKTGERSYEGARKELHESLEKLGCDQIDMIQLHNLTQEPDHAEAFSDEGCVRAVIEARDEGLVRFIGVTGHGTRAPAMHLRSLENFAFDSVLFPYSYSQLGQAEYKRDVEALIAVCQERGVAMQTIKAVARRRWGHDAETTRLAWYEPIEEPTAFEHAVHFVLAREALHLNTSSDLVILERTLTAAARFAEAGTAPSDEELSAALANAGVQPLFVPGLDDVGRAPA